MFLLNKIYLKTIIKVFLAVTALALFLITIVGFYFLGVLRGYELGQKDYEIGLAGFLTEREISSDSKEEVLITPTPNIIKKVVTMPVTPWGGPELWSAVNKRRREFGVNPLTQRDELCTIASIRLNELLELGKLDGHEGFSNMEERRPDLKWIFEKYSTIAEFLAMGGKTPEETVSLWENTLGHKKLLTGGEYVWGCIYAQNTFAVAIVAF